MITPIIVPTYKYFCIVLQNYLWKKLLEIDGFHDFPLCIICILECQRFDNVATVSVLDDIDNLKIDYHALHKLQCELKNSETGLKIKNLIRNQKLQLFNAEFQNIRRVKKFAESLRTNPESFRQSPSPTPQNYLKPPADDEEKRKFENVSVVESLDLEFDVVIVKNEKDICKYFP